MIIISSSYEPTSAAVGQAATAAPSRPCPTSARVSAQCSHRETTAPGGWYRELSARRVEHDHLSWRRTARSSSAGPAKPSGPPHHAPRTRALACSQNTIAATAATPTTAAAVDHLMIRSTAIIGRHRQPAKIGSISKYTGLPWQPRRPADPARWPWRRRCETCRPVPSMRAWGRVSAAGPSMPIR